MRAGGHRDSRAKLTLARGSQRTFASQQHLWHTFASGVGGNGQCRGALFLFGQWTLDAGGERAKGHLRVGGVRWQRITAEIITMAEALAPDDVV
jgi:hypothetical protein